MIHKAKDLSPSQKVTLEGLLGRALRDQEEISIRALAPTPGLPDERRREILNGLNRYFAEIDAQRQPCSSEEAERIIDNAQRSTRPHYRPVR